MSDRIDLMLEMMRELKIDFRSHVTDEMTAIDALDKRVRVLEKWRSWLVGVIAAISTGLGITWTGMK
jgi:hypothetical protein